MERLKNTEATFARLVILGVLFFMPFTFNSKVMAEEIDGNEAKVDTTKETEAEIVRKSIEYLVGQKQEDGSFNGSYTYNTTSELCFVMGTYTDVDIASNLQWMNSYSSITNIDEYARRVLALRTADDLETIMKQQNKDGGFGLTKEYVSDVLDSLLVLEAANKVPSKKYEKNVAKLVEYLSGKCKENGSYTYVLEGYEYTSLTARVLYAFAEYKIVYKVEDDSLNEVMDRITEYIKTYYSVNLYARGSEDTLYSALALQLTGNDFLYEELIEKIKNRQNANGSIFDDSHLTALVVWLLKDSDIDRKTIEDDIQEVISTEITTESIAENETPKTPGKTDKTTPTGKTIDTKNNDTVTSDDSSGNNTNPSDDKNGDRKNKNSDSDNNSDKDNSGKKPKKDNTIDNDNTSEKPDTTNSHDGGSSDDQRQNNQSDIQNKDNPRTADSFNALAVIVLIISLLTITVICVMKKRETRKND